MKKRVFLVCILLLVCFSLNACYKKSQYVCEHLNFEEVGDRIEPTCKAGSVKMKCEDCGYKYTKTLPAIYEHTKGKEETTPATCSKEGEIREYCSKCNEVFSTTPIEKLPHTPGEWKITQMPTCKGEGTEKRFCTVCENACDSRQITASGHDLVIQAAKEPTCTKTGLTQGHYCRACSNEKVEQQTLRPVGHHFEGLNNTCTRCHNSEIAVIRTSSALGAINAAGGAVVYLDDCISSSSDKIYTICVFETSGYVRLIGTSGKSYPVRIEFRDGIKTFDGFTLDLVNVTLSTKESIITGHIDADQYFALNMYGERCGIVAAKGADGINGSSLSGSGSRGGNGENGNPAIDATGTIHLTVESTYCTIKGGDGGNGGNGIKMIARNGSDGGDGGNGGVAVRSASLSKSIAVGSADGFVLEGGKGGKGGDPGPGDGLLYKEGNPGRDGQDAEAYA